MPNLSQLRRQKMLEFLSKIKEEHKDDDDTLIALGEIENELTSKKYGLVWEKHEEAVDVKMKTHIPVRLIIRGIMILYMKINLWTV